MTLYLYYNIIITILSISTSVLTPYNPASNRLCFDTLQPSFQSPSIRAWPGIHPPVVTPDLTRNPYSPTIKIKAKHKDKKIHKNGPIGPKLGKVLLVFRSAASLLPRVLLTGQKNQNPPGYVFDSM